MCACLDVLRGRVCAPQDEGPVKKDEPGEPWRPSKGRHSRVKRTCPWRLLRRPQLVMPSMTAAQHSERKLPAKRSQYVVRHHEAGCCAVLASEEALMWDRHHACSTESPRVAELFRCGAMRHAVRAVSVPVCIRRYTTSECDIAASCDST